jgi:hypothetical protein
MAIDPCNIAPTGYSVFALDLDLAHEHVPSAEKSYVAREATARKEKPPLTERLSQ